MRELWTAIFGNDHPVEVEIGPGTGTFILPAAQRSPHANFFGLERSHNRAARLQSAIAASGLANARIIAADASCVVSTFIPDESVRAYHIYFPDPWWKRRHHRRRLFTPPLAIALARTLVPGGRICLATDVDETFARMLVTLEASGRFARDQSARPVRTAITAFERKGLARGATIKEATFVKMDGASILPELYTSSAAPITPAESPS